jgi:hypothetical protein
MKVVLSPALDLEQKLKDEKPVLLKCRIQRKRIRSIRSPGSRTHEFPAEECLECPPQKTNVAATILSLIQKPGNRNELWNAHHKGRSVAATILSLIPNLANWNKH